MSVTKFRSTLRGYLHNSVNPEAYERNCIDRFFGLLALMTGHALHRVIHLDAKSCNVSDQLIGEGVMRESVKRHGVSLTQYSDCGRVWSVESEILLQE